MLCEIKAIPKTTRESKKKSNRLIPTNQKDSGSMCKIVVACVCNWCYLWKIGIFILVGIRAPQWTYHSCVGTHILFHPTVSGSLSAFGASVEVWDL